MTGEGARRVIYDLPVDVAQAAFDSDQGPLLRGVWCSPE